MRTTNRLVVPVTRALLADHGLIETRDLVAAGLSYQQISLLMGDGLLDRVIRGLYRIPGTRTPVQDIAAAVSRHRSAAASHTSALLLHGLGRWQPIGPHVTLRPGDTSRSRLATLHRSPLDLRDRVVVDGIPSVRPARAVADAAEFLGVDDLAGLVNRCLAGRLATIDSLQETIRRLEQAPGRIGLGRLRVAMRPWTDAIMPDSPAEAAAIRRIIDFGLPPPTTQHEVRDPEGRFVARLDLAWPDRLVAREYQSVEFHGPDRTEHDELRVQRLEALGWSVGVVTRQDLPPASTGWLRALERELRGSSRRAG